MRFIAESDAQRLREHLHQRLEGSVALELFIEPTSALIVAGWPPCELCEETRALLEDLASLSERITLNVHDVQVEHDLARQMNVTHVPTLVMRGACQGVVRYVGIPAGLEFGTLLEDLVVVASGTTALAEATRGKLAALTNPVHVQVFVTPTCPYCPKVAHLAHQIAVESANVIADVIEVGEFPDLAARYRVHGVPKVVIDDTVELVGAQPEAVFVDAILRAAA